MRDRDASRRLAALYERLLKRFGRQNWWPADSSFEVIVGAILTQQSSWKNVEKAIANLKEENMLTPQRIATAKIETLEWLVRPSGFYRQKALRLKNFSKFLLEKYHGELDSLFSQDLDTLRRELLSLNGVGHETADSIILYAANKPTFVVDAYTVRILGRLGILSEKAYDTVQKYLHANIPNDVQHYKEFHALLVRLAKENCRTRPACDGCPLAGVCAYELKEQDHKVVTDEDRRGFSPSHAEGPAVDKSNI